MAIGLLASFNQVVVVTNEETAVFPEVLLESGRLLTYRPDALPDMPGSFDLVAFPQGFTQAPDEQLSWARQYLKKTGVLYVGFSNRWSYRRLQGQPIAKESTWTLSQVTKRLQEAGYGEQTVYGCVPNAQQPKTIFPLTDETIGLALSHSWRKARADLAQRWATAWPWRLILPHVLPGYAIVAKSER